MYFIRTLLLSLLFFISACATTATGTDFEQVKKSDSEYESIVYIYRPAEGIFSGINTVFNLTVDDKPIGPLKKGGYLATQLPHGNSRFVAKTNAFSRIMGSVPSIDIYINIPENENTYLKVVTSRNINSNSISLQSVPEEFALKEMKTLKLSN